MDTSAPWLDVFNPLLASALLVAGLICMLTRRRVVKQLIGLNIMLQGAILNLLDAGRVHGDLATPQGLIVSALVAETMVTAIALALVVNVFRYHPEGLVDDMDSLKG